MTEQRIVEADGRRWLVRKGTDDHLGPSTHESGLWAILSGLLPEDGTFLDVGAHVGHWTVRMASRAKRVIAVEPSPQTLFGLGVNIGLNGLANVTLVDQIMVGRSGDGPRLGEWASLRDPNGLVAGGSASMLANAPASAYARCGTVDFLDLAEVHVVKIDVEGAEAMVLDGARETIDRHRPALVIEMHHAIYGSHIADQVRAFVEEYGYTATVAMRSGEIEYWVCIA